MPVAGENNNLNHRRLIIYAVTTPVFPLAYHFLRNSNRRNRAELHTRLKAMTTLIMPVVGITALCR